MRLFIGFTFLFLFGVGVFAKKDKAKVKSKEFIVTEILACHVIKSSSDLGCPVSGPCCDVTGAKWVVERTLDQKKYLYPLYANGKLPACQFDKCHASVVNPKIEAQGVYVFDQENQRDDFQVKTFKIIPASK